ncbi:unnamed protein product [Adineta steineri]|uniref:Uncharacterized protein n=1 Tax=Adineta steineri TaxID=433720 RepID=A0A813MTI2_9BILA|nr:unnamed protein product [Adineta steineri]
MFHTCEISTCDSPTLITCVCCNKSLCREHFVEHDYLLRPKLNELTKQINKIFDQFESLDMKTIMSDSLKKIDEWRLNSYQVIDKFYENKCTELNYYINNILNKYAKDINDLRLKIEKMTYIQQTTNHNIELLTKNIQTLQQQINQIKYISIQVDIRPLVIIDKLIDVNIITDLSKLSTPYQTIQRIPLCSNAMANALPSSETTRCFSTLVNAYKPSLERDSTLVQYVERIGTLFFGIKQKSAPSSNPLENLMHSLTANMSNGARAGHHQHQHQTDLDLEVD